VRGTVFGQFEDTPDEDDDEGEVTVGRNKFLSVIAGQKELKWDLYEILKKAGLRKVLYNCIE